MAHVEAQHYTLFERNLLDTGATRRWRLRRTSARCFGLSCLSGAGILRDLYDRRWNSYSVFTGMCLYQLGGVITDNDRCSYAWMRAIPIGLQRIEATTVLKKECHGPYLCFDSRDLLCRHGRAGVRL
jgi:hypothetical protein